jgi:hypothetical protein
LWQRIFSNQVPGQIKNVYTKSDYILLLYSFAESDWAIGRNPIFEKMLKGSRNLSVMKDDEPAISDLECIRVRNYDIKEVTNQIGHLKYRENL